MERVQLLRRQQQVKLNKKETHKSKVKTDISQAQSKKSQVKTN